MKGVHMYAYQSDNSRQEIQLRRWRDILAINGSTVIILSIWDILKMYLGFFLGEDRLKGVVAGSVKEAGLSGGERELVAKIITWIVIMAIITLVSAIIFLFHLYIGMNAYKAGRQTAEKKKKGYLVLAAFSLFCSAFLVIVNVVSLFFHSGAESNIRLTSVMMESVAFFNYLYLLVAAAKIRKIEEVSHDDSTKD